MEGRFFSYESYNRAYDLREVLNKLPIEIRETDETLNSFYGLRRLLIKDSLYLLGIYSYALLYFHDKSEIFRSLNLEFVFIDVDLETRFSETLKDLPYVVSILYTGAVRID